MLLFSCKKIAYIGKMILYSLNILLQMALWQFNEGKNREKRQEKKNNVEVKHVTKSVWESTSKSAQSWLSNLVTY